MPVVTPAGFDAAFGISARTFGALVESQLRPVITAIGPPIPTPGGNVDFDDLRVEAWFGTIPGADLEIRIGFRNMGGPGGISLGPGWSDLFVPATLTAPVVPGPPPTADLVVTLDRNAATFDADDESQLVPPFTEANIAAAIALLLPPSASLTGGAGFPLVAAAPPAAVGAMPGTSAVSVGFSRRPAQGAVGEEAAIVLFTFQDRPNTPPGRAPGNPAAMPPLAFGAGQDLLLELSNTFLLELIASLGLEAGMAIPPATLTVNGAGITLAPPPPPPPIVPARAPATIGGIAGRFTALTVTPPAPGTTSLTLAGTFRFTRDSITYQVAIAGVTITVALEGGAIVIASAGGAITPSVVNVPWWVYVAAILTGAALGALAGGIVFGFVGAVAGAVAGAVVAGIGVAAFAGLGGALPAPGLGGTGLLPPALAGLMGPLSPPLVFDDLSIGARANILDSPIKVLRKVTAEELPSRSALDFDSGDLVMLAHRIGPSELTGFDIGWDPTYGLGVASTARMAVMEGVFRSVTYTDVANALEASPASILEPLRLPLLNGAALSSGTPPAGLLIGVRTERDRLVKALVWRTEDRTLVIRYQVWDASAASIRIFPDNPQWRVTDTLRLFGRMLRAHTATFTAATHRLSSPVTYRWALEDTPLDGSSSAATAFGTVSWSANGPTLELDLALGTTLDDARLICIATDAAGIVASESVQLTVQGRIVGDGIVPEFDHPGLAAAGERFRNLVDAAIQSGVYRTPAVRVNPRQPDPAIDGLDAVLRAAIRAGDPAIRVEELELR